MGMLKFITKKPFQRLGPYIIALVIGISSTLIANKFEEPSPELTISYDTDFRGGLTVMDLTVANTGDFRLQNLSGTIELEKTFKLSVANDSLLKYVNVDSNRLSFFFPPDFSIKPKYGLTFRMTSEGPNKIKDPDLLPDKIEAKYVNVEIVKGKMMRSSSDNQIESIKYLLLVSVVLLIIGLGIIVFLFFIYKAWKPKPLISTDQ